MSLARHRSASRKYTCPTVVCCPPTATCPPSAPAHPLAEADTFYAQTIMASLVGQDHGPLYHLVQQPLWQKCKAKHTPYTPPTYAADGFIHLTKEAPLLLGVANHFYKEVTDDFLVLVIDSQKLTSKVVFEAAAPVGSTQPSEQTSQHLFPHLYGPVNLDAVIQELTVRRDQDGTFLAIDGLNSSS